MNGIKIYDDVPGSGKAAETGDEVTTCCRFFLNHGDPIQAIAGMEEVTVTFCIGRRSMIAGVEKGVVGMMAGGKRRLRISPHLAYRGGIAGLIPPNAVLICEVEMVDIAGEPTGMG